MNTLLIIGAGAHGRIVAEAATAAGRHTVLGFADDDPAKRRLVIDDWSVLGGAFEVAADEYVVAIGLNPGRRRIFEELLRLGRTVATVISPLALVSPRAQIGAGSVVLAGAIVQAGARIGRNVVINAGAVIDHDTSIGDHAHVGPNATVLSFGAVAPEEWLGGGETRSGGR